MAAIDTVAVFSVLVFVITEKLPTEQKAALPSSANSQSVR
jgi:hypothetical protein